MNLQKIKDELKAFLKKEDMKLYDLSYKRKDNILEVTLDESLDLNELEVISNKISNFMDSIDEDMDQYLLDVNTVGIERPIRNLEEVKKAIGNYVFIKTKDKAINGNLISLEEEVLTVSYKDKTTVKQLKIDYKDVKEMRYAVKF